MTTNSKHRFVTIAKKIITALTGLALCIYLVGHLGGNLLLLMSGSAFNTYAHTLTGLPFIIPVEIGLAALFLLHAYEALAITYQNRKARPVGYESKTWARTKSPKSRKTVSSTFMMWTGIAILIFTVLHVWHLKFGEYRAVQPDGTVITETRVMPDVEGSPEEASSHEMRDLHWLVVREFKKPWITGLYLASMLILGMHLYHAVWSAFQTLGVTNPLLRKAILYAGNGFTFIICGGFAFIPIWVMFFYKD